MAELRARWADAKEAYGQFAAIERGIIEAFVPPVFWPVVAALILDGPGVAAGRVEALLRREAQRVVRPTAARPQGGSVSSGQLGNLGKALVRVMRTLVELRLRRQAEVDRAVARLAGGEQLGPVDHMLTLLAPWTALPRIDRPMAPSHVTDTSAPPLEVVRAAWSALNSEISSIFRAPLEDQPALVDSLPSAKMQGLFLRLRNRTMLTLLAILGCRVHALSLLRVGDYDRGHLCPDGQVRPAVALRPGKSHDSDEIHWKPIPPGAGIVVEVFLAFLERRLKRTLDPSWPLIPAKLADPSVAWDPSNIRALLGHARWSTRTLADGSVRRYLRPPLLPKPGSQHGYSPHTLRGTVQQSIRDYGGRWLERNGYPAGAAVLRLTGEALVDHSTLVEDPLGYLGGSKPHGRERYSVLGTHIMWDVLEGPSPRTSGDREGYIAAFTRRLALEHEKRRLDEEAATAEADVDPSNQDSFTEFLIASQRIRRRRDQIAEELAETREDLRDIRTNPARRVSVPDDLAHVEPVDFDAIERDLLNGGGRSTRERVAGRRRVRDWITPREFTFVLTGNRENTGSSVRRWLDCGPPKGRPYWDAENPPIETFSPKRRALVVAGLELALLDDGQRARLFDLLARPAPQGWDSFPGRV